MGGVMAESDFWRDLAEEIRPIDPHQLLRADWHCVVKVGETAQATQWRLVGAGRLTRSLQLEFEALARRGGAKIHPLMDSLTAWLEELRDHGFNVEHLPTAVESNPDGVTVAHIDAGSIMQVCQVSVDLCKLLESQALETERRVLIRTAAFAPDSVQQNPGGEPAVVPGSGVSIGAVSGSGLAPAIAETPAKFSPDPKGVSGDPSPSFHRPEPLRTPDLQLSRDRITLVKILARELAIVKEATGRRTSVEQLKQRFPDFTLWTLIERSQMQELVDGTAFTPKAYAESLVLAKYGITSWQTLKKDRDKLNTASRAGKK
jgi:hypothetical protein